MSPISSGEDLCRQTIDAGGCVVLAPGLLSGVQSLAAGSALLSGNLARLLNSAKLRELPEEHIAMETLAAAALLPAGGKPAAAAFSFTLDFPDSDSLPGTQATDGFVMRADPAYQQIDMNNATLGNPQELELTTEECFELQATLNQHFTEDGMRFESKDPYRWYCHFTSVNQAPLQVTTNPVSASIGRDVAVMRPTGTDARSWRSKLAEIEMLLFEHPVNITRQGKNKLPVNTLWLWGEGDLAVKDQVKKISVYSDHFYTNSVASYAGLPRNNLPEATAAFSHADGAALVAIDKFTRSHLQSAESDSHSNLQWADSVLSEQLWSGLQSAGWPEITLWFGDNRLFQVNASAKRQWWRRWFKKVKPLSDYLPDMTSQQIPPAEPARRQPVMRGH